MFRHTSRYYDRIYAFKDYEREAIQVHLIIQAWKRSSGNRLLDVACGTGGHSAPLSRFYEVEGLDLDPGMLEVARAKRPDLPFQQGDMVDFHLGRRFDAVICLFSSIAYVQTKERLQQAVANMAGHLEPGGVLLVEPWIEPQQWRPGHLDALLVDEPELKIARLSLSDESRGPPSRLTFHYLIATPGGIEHLTEEHQLGLFSRRQYLEAFGQAGLEVHFDPQGLIGRGLYLGTKPLA